VPLPKPAVGKVKLAVPLELVVRGLLGKTTVPDAFSICMMTVAPATLEPFDLTVTLPVSVCPALKRLDPVETDTESA